MALPSSGQISFSDIATITKGNATSEISIGEANTRYLFGVPSGSISISTGYGKPAAGSNTYSTPGSYSWLVYPYQTVFANVAAGGGGGGEGAYYAFLYYFAIAEGGSGGNSGANSSFNGLSATAGTGGGGGGFASFGGAGTNGGGSGGSVTTGGGGAGGGGGSGYFNYAFQPAYSGGNGGAGGKVTQQWSHQITSGFPVWAGSYPVTVGGGGGVNVGGYNAGTPGNGANGWVTINWS
jgi:hypothetical protein